MKPSIIIMYCAIYLFIVMTVPFHTISLGDFLSKRTFAEREPLSLIFMSTGATEKSLHVKQ